MKHVWMVLGLALVTAVAMPTHAEPIAVQVEVDGVRSDTGRVLVALHDDRWAFPSRWDRAVVMGCVAAAEGTVRLSLQLPRAGRFALIVVHDEDDDGRMKKSALGLPREGYATGRNSQALEFPLFDPALRDWAGGTRVSVRLLYP